METPHSVLGNLLHSSVFPDTLSSSTWHFVSTRLVSRSCALKWGFYIISSCNWPWIVSFQPFPNLPFDVSETCFEARFLSKANQLNQMHQHTHFTITIFPSGQWYFLPPPAVSFLFFLFLFPLVAYNQW